MSTLIADKEPTSTPGNELNLVTGPLEVLEKEKEKEKAGAPQGNENTFDVFFHAIVDLRTTLPGALLILLPFLIQRHIIAPDLGDVIQQLVTLLFGSVLLGINSKKH